MVTEKELNELRGIIEACRELTGKHKVKEGISLSCVFTILYASVLLRMCEIYTLLKGGYPEGAMALARHTYEAWIIMRYLYDRREDQELIERFYDDLRVRTCHDAIKYCEWRIANGIDNEDTHKELQDRRQEYESLLEKYAGFTSGKSPRFETYWWAGKENGRSKSFRKLREETGNLNNFYYDLACYRVHAGMAGMQPFDNTEEGLLIGACAGGKEAPFQFALFNFTAITGLYFGVLGVEGSSIFDRMKSLHERVRLPG